MRNIQRMRNTQWMTNMRRIPELVRENFLPTTLALIVVIQFPFTILYFTARPQPAPVGQQQRRVEKPAFKPAVQPPILESREDPFAPLPGMQEKKPNGSADGSGPQILEVFRGDLTAPSGQGNNQGNGIAPLPISVQPLPLPTISPPPSPPGLKLNGVVRYRGKAMAVFQMQDKSTAHVAEGERVAGTDCYVKTILSTKVLIKWQNGDSNAENWLFVGEEWRT